MTPDEMIRADRDEAVYSMVTLRQALKLLRRDVIEAKVSSALLGSPPNWGEVNGSLDRSEVALSDTALLASDVHDVVNAARTVADTPFYADNDTSIMSTPYAEAILALEAALYTLDRHLVGEP